MLVLSSGSANTIVKKYPIISSLLFNQPLLHPIETSISTPPIKNLTQDLFLSLYTLNLLNLFMSLFSFFCQFLIFLFNSSLAKYCCILIVNHQFCTFVKICNVNISILHRSCWIFKLSSHIISRSIIIVQIFFSSYSSQSKS